MGVQIIQISLVFPMLISFLDIKMKFRKLRELKSYAQQIRMTNLQLMYLQYKLSLHVDRLNLPALENRNIMINYFLPMDSLHPR